MSLDNPWPYLALEFEEGPGLKKSSSLLLRDLLSDILIFNRILLE